MNPMHQDDVGCLAGSQKRIHPRAVAFRHSEVAPMIHSEQL